MEKIDLVKWWSESTLAVRFNALVGFILLGSVSLNIYQHKEAKSDAEFYQRSVTSVKQQADSIINFERDRFDTAINDCRMELKACYDEKYNEAKKDAEKYKDFLYEQKKLNY